MGLSKADNRRAYREALDRGRERIGAVLGTETPAGRVTVTLPNYLTLGRLIVVPFFWYGFLSPAWGLQVTATLLFAMGALSDLWDGKIARRRGEITRFGDFMDPLADKLLVLSGFWAVIVREQLGWFDPAALLFVVVITLREAGLTLLRVKLIRVGSAIVTSLWGKWKTAVQLIALLATMTALNVRDLLVANGYSPEPFVGEPFSCTVTLLFLLSAATSVISAALYLRETRVPTGSDS